ncbi:MAG: hypothetical protein ACYSWU_27710, partial [Planctomycetota bacterium]
LPGEDNDFQITDAIAGTDTNVVFVSNLAAGDQAIVTYDAGTSTLTIDFDPLATTANTVVAAINAEGTFTAALDATDPDDPNDGSGAVGAMPVGGPTQSVGFVAISVVGPNNDITITANTPGSPFDNTEVFVVANQNLIGDQAVVTFDATSVPATLTIEVNPAATTASTVVAAINAEGTFTGTLEPIDPDNPPNDGSGLIGTPPVLLPPVPAGGSATMQLPGEDNDFQITDALAGTDTNVVFVSGVAVGDQAFVTYDAGTSTLTIDFDPLATTANTVVAAINAEGTFTAALEATDPDDPNDGSGAITGTTIFELDTETAAADTTVEFVSIQASGDQAFVAFDANTDTLTIDYDAAATTANTLVMAIVTDGTFTAALTGPDAPNNGTGLVGALTAPPPIAAGASVAFAPADPNNDFTITAGVTFNAAHVRVPIDTAFSAAEVAVAVANAINNAGLIPPVIATAQGDLVSLTPRGTAFDPGNTGFTALTGVTGDNALVVFDIGSDPRTLTIYIDPTATTASTIVAAINAEGTFQATLQSGNDGSGRIDPTELGVVLGTTAGGSGVPSFTLAMGSDGVTPSSTGIDGLSDYPIPFNAADTWQDLVASVATAINTSGANLSAQVQEGNVVAVDVPLGTDPRALRVYGDAPLDYRGEGPGGDVTGMAYLGGDLYVVSDRGGLYRLVGVENYGLHP